MGIYNCKSCWKSTVNSLVIIAVGSEPVNPILILMGRQFSNPLWWILCSEPMRPYDFMVFVGTLAVWERYAVKTSGPAGVKSILFLVLLKEMKMLDETKISSFCLWC